MEMDRDVTYSPIPRYCAMVLYCSDLENAGPIMARQIGPYVDSTVESALYSSRKSTHLFESVSQTDHLIICLILHSNQSGKVCLGDRLVTLNEAISAYLTNGGETLERRRVGRENGFSPKVETWVAVVCCGDVYDSFITRNNIIPDLRKRFSHILLFHERLVEVKKAGAWLGHFFGLLVDPEFDLPIKDLIPRSMAVLEGASGIVYATDVNTYLYRQGNLKTKPFGLQRESCLEEGCSQIEIRVVKLQAIPPPSPGYELTYKCRRHQEFRQVFGSGLICWWPAGESGHIAVFDRILPVP